MKTFKCRGTLGDSYIVNCVVHGLASREKILIKQCSDYAGNAVDHWEPHIRQIYSLMPKIQVEFVNKEEFNSLPSQKFPRLWPSIEKAREREGGMSVMNPHPPFKFPATKQVTGSYIACSPRGGKSNEGHRQVGEDEISSLIEEYKDQQFVLVGDNPEFLGYSRHNVTNLIGKTSILEAIGIVSRAKKFIGVQGLMVYVAASSKVPSFVYTKSVGYDKAFRSRLFPEWERYCSVVKTCRSEDPLAFKRFMI
ncbi:hypothetical protein LCGC14_0245090 [marine sediment metagenome]|uniref:Uncharacterized protein n=1 Tax=marine sediment metagenome TaxID=412755 RepID=A0A0F9UN26_9ZZZZ